MGDEERDADVEPAVPGGRGKEIWCAEDGLCDNDVVEALLFGRLSVRRGKRWKDANC